MQIEQGLYMYSAIKYFILCLVLAVTACSNSIIENNDSAPVFGISNIELKNAQTGKPYKETLTANGGSGNYNFTLTGTLPAGLTFNSDGTITGNVTESTGSFPVTVTCIDTSDSSKKDSKNLTLNVTDTPWTIMIHFAIDNNIDYEYEKFYGIVSDYINTLQNIKKNDTSNKLNILIMMDGFNADTHFKDGLYVLKGSTNFIDDLSYGLTEINSGDLNSTKMFMDFALKKYPAKKYMYSIFNHGGGFDDVNKEGTGNLSGSSDTTLLDLIKELLKLFGGIGIDETSGNDSLSLYELGKAFEYFTTASGGDRVDLFFPFACLMGNAELVYETKSNVNYVLFSEESFPAEYWSYEALEEILTDSSITPVNLGKKFCDSAYTYFSDSTVKRNFTLSLIDNSKIDQLYSNLDLFADSAKTIIDADQSKALYFNTAADNSFSMDTDGDDPNFYYIDLGNYLDNINSTAELDSSIKTLASNVKSSLLDSVIYKTNYGYPNATGMTIFHNIWKSRYQYEVSTYKNILTAGNTRWALYMDKMTSLETVINPSPAADLYEPDTSNVILTGETQDHTLHDGTSNDTDIIILNLSSITSSKYICIETSKLSVDTNTEVFLYDSSANLISSVRGNIGSLYSKMVNQLNAGIYYIYVRGYYTRYGDYKIKVSEEQKDSYEADDSFNDAVSIGVGESQLHNFISYGESDYLTFTLTAETAITIETKPQFLFCHTYLYLYDSSHNILDSSVDFNSTSYSKITQTLPAGTYYIKVWDAYVKGGDYIIELY